MKIVDVAFALVSVTVVVVPAVRVAPAFQPVIIRSRKVPVAVKNKCVPSYSTAPFSGVVFKVPAVSLKGAPEAPATPALRCSTAVGDVRPIPTLPCIIIPFAGGVPYAVPVPAPPTANPPAYNDVIFIPPSVI